MRSKQFLTFMFILSFLFSSSLFSEGYRICLRSKNVGTLYLGAYDAWPGRDRRDTASLYVFGHNNKYSGHPIEDCFIWYLEPVNDHHFIEQKQFHQKITELEQENLSLKNRIERLEEMIWGS